MEYLIEDTDLKSESRFDLHRLKPLVYWAIALLFEHKNQRGQNRYCTALTHRNCKGLVKQSV